MCGTPAARRGYYACSSSILSDGVRSEYNYIYKIEEGVSQRGGAKRFHEWNGPHHAAEVCPEERLRRWAAVGEDTGLERFTLEALLVRADMVLNFIIFII